MTAAEAARGIAEIVDETMASAARVHAVENGKDTAGRTLIAFGGAAPLHAARLAQKLGISRVVIPRRCRRRLRARLPRCADRLRGRAHLAGAARRAGRRHGRQTCSPRCATRPKRSCGLASHAAR